MDFNLFSLGSTTEVDLSQVFDVVIIGGGPGGLTAALYTGRYRLNTLIIERELLSGGQMMATEWIENYPGFEEPVMGSDLAKQMEAQAIKAGVQILRASVSQVTLSESIKSLVTTKGEVKSKSLIFATGTHPRSLGIPGEEAFRGKGISYCATCDGPFNEGKTIAVIGGGNTALQESLFLTKFVKKLYLIHRRDEFRADKILQEKIFQNPKIEVVLNAKPTEINFEDQKARFIQIEKEGLADSIPVDSIFIFAGIIPNNELFKEMIALNHDGYVITDENMKTNIDGVFAVGDIRTKSLRQIATAIGDGAVAAHSAEMYLAEQSI